MQKTVHLQQLKGMQCVLGMRKGYHLLIKRKKGVPFLSNMTAANIILIILLYFSFYQ